MSLWRRLLALWYSIIVIVCGINKGNDVDQARNVIKSVTLDWVVDIIIKNQ